MCVYSINMPNLQQNNEIDHINKEINILQDLIKKIEKSQNHFQNGLMQIGKKTSKKRTINKSFSNQKNAKYSE